MRSVLCIVVAVAGLSLTGDSAEAQGFFARRANVRAAATQARATNQAVRAVNANIRSAQVRGHAVVAAPVVAVTNYQRFRTPQIVAFQAPVVYQTHSLGVVGAIPVRQAFVAPVYTSPSISTSSIHVSPGGSVTINTQGFYQ